MARKQRRTAFLYDAPLATAEDVALLKSMLLFFDDLAVFSAPGHRPGSPAIDPRFAAPLAERGLLHLVDPRRVLAPHTETIVRAALHRAAIEHEERWVAAAAAGDWDVEVPRLQGRFPKALMPGGDFTAPAPGAGSLDLFKLLAQEGLLFPDESTNDDWDVTPGYPSVTNSIMAQAVCATARQPGWFMEPVATRRDEARVFAAILDAAVQGVGAADVVMSDLSVVGPSFRHAGLDDILDFRARHQSQLRAYVQALQALLAPDPRRRDVTDRSAAVADQARQLRELLQRRWTETEGTVRLGIVGASWTLASGDLLGAVIGGTAAGSQLLPDRPTPVSAYTYLLRPDTEPAT